MRCVFSSLGECIAKIPEACECAKMPSHLYREAHKRMFGRPLFTVEEHLQAVETAIVAFRWARNDPESHAGKVFLTLKDLASALRQELQEPSKVVLRS